MLNAMERIGIDSKLITLVEQFYKNTAIKVEVDGHSSDWHNQHRHQPRMSTISIPTRYSNDRNV